MSTKSIIRINKSAPTTIDFNLDVNGTKAEPHVMLVIENVINGCDLSIPAKCKNGKWSVTIPNIQNFTESEYSTHLDVIIDGFIFTPAKGTLKPVDAPVMEVVASSRTRVLSESTINESGSSDDPGASIVVSDEVRKPEFPVDNDFEGDEPEKDIVAKLDVRNKQSDHDKQQEDKLASIASKVNGVEGPQLPIVPDTVFPEYNVIETATSIIRGVIPQLAKPTTKGTLLGDLMKHTLNKDTDAVAKINERSKLVSQAIKSAAKLPNKP